MISYSLEEFKILFEDDFGHACTESALNAKIKCRKTAICSCVACEYARVDASMKTHSMKKDH